MQLDPCDKDHLFVGLLVRIKTEDNKIIEGKIKEILSFVKYNFAGALVKLEKIENVEHVGNVIEIPTEELSETEIEIRALLRKFELDILQEEGQHLEFKETFAFPTGTTQKIEDVEPSQALMFVVGKTVQAFANTEGGTLYIGVEDRTKILKGLERDYALKHIPKRNRDADGLEIKIRETLENFFQRDKKIFYNGKVKVKIIKIKGKDVCIINVKISDVPLILYENGKSNGKEFYHIRVGNESKSLTGNEFMDYWAEQKYKL